MQAMRLELFGRDAKQQKAIATARNLAVTKVPVLIYGEVGTGKRTLAQFIHENSNRKSSTFDIVDCSESSQVVENNILGYREESGKFHRGALERCNGGTVVLANIDAIGEDFQKKLHKILNELKDYDLDVRIIATTTKNLTKLVGAGHFYRGLYTMVGQNMISLCPLRERLADIEYISRCLISEVSNVSAEEVKIEQDALNRLLNHSWSFNLSELKDVIEAAQAESLEPSVLKNELLDLGEKRTTEFTSDDDNEGFKLMSLRDAEKLLIKKALVHTSENRTQAAKILGVSIRTLRNKINEYRTEGATYFVNLR